MMLTIVASALVGVSILLVMGGLALMRTDKTVSERLGIYLVGGSTDPLTLQELELAPESPQRAAHAPGYGRQSFRDFAGRFRRRQGYLHGRGPGHGARDRLP